MRTKIDEALCSGSYRNLLVIVKSETLAIKRKRISLNQPLYRNISHAKLKKSSGNVSWHNSNPFNLKKSTISQQSKQLVMILMISISAEFD